MLGLALAAGSVLSDIWTDKLLTVFKSTGIVVENYAPTFIAVLIILIPVAIFLFKGYSYKNLISRLIGSAMFSLLAMAFLIEPLGHFWVVQGLGEGVFNFVLEKRFVIIGVGLLLAIGDFFIAKPAHKAHKERTH